ncbi:MAG: hypothetical protein ACYCSF_08220 [Acidimicrobiales bacterium]
MGWCNEFGSEITAGCDHAMQASTESCTCPECGVICSGRFKACPAVWAAGPRTVVLARRRPVATSRAVATAGVARGPVHSNGIDPRMKQLSQAVEEQTAAVAELTEQLSLALDRLGAPRFAPSDRRVREDVSSRHLGNGAQPTVIRDAPAS